MFHGNRRISEEIKQLVTFYQWPSSPTQSSTERNQGQKFSDKVRIYMSDVIKGIKEIFKLFDIYRSILKGVLYSAYPT